jgi:hypothetical protein
MAFLTVRVKGAEGYTRFALGKERTVIGRASACDLPVQAQNISREHCVVVRRGEDWWLEDLGSANGTRINADKVTVPRKLAEKDIIKAGAVRLTFHAGEMAAAAAIEVAGSEVVQADDHEGDAVGDPSRDTPDRAIACVVCGGWYSVAHRGHGQSSLCPRCNQANNVP